LAETLASLAFEGNRAGAARESLTGERLPRVLVVDQSRTMRALVRALLGDGFQVLEASSGEEALDLLERELIAAVVCQSVLPGQSGLDLCRKMRSRESLTTIPFVLLAADVRPDLERRAEEAGAQAVLPKKLDAELLRGTIEKVRTSNFQLR
jgi:CheY-like chemotaxis protein